MPRRSDPAFSELFRTRFAHIPSACSSSIDHQDQQHESADQPAHPHQRERPRPRVHVIVSRNQPYNPGGVRRLAGSVSCGEDDCRARADTFGPLARTRPSGNTSSSSGPSRSRRRRSRRRRRRRWTPRVVSTVASWLRPSGKSLDQERQRLIAGTNRGQADDLHLVGSVQTSDVGRANAAFTDDEPPRFRLPERAGASDDLHLALSVQHRQQRRPGCLSEYPR